MNPFQRGYFLRMLQQPDGRSSAAVPRLSDCGTICLLCNYTTEPHMLQEWEHFRKFHADFQVVLFYEGKPYQGIIFNKLDVMPFAASNFNFFGRVPADVLHKLQSNRYSLLVNTIARMDDRMAMVHRWIPAGFKVGRDAAYGHLNDLSMMMEETADTGQYLHYVRNYMEKLNG